MSHNRRRHAPRTFARLSTAQTQALEQVERAKDATLSQQPRFNPVAPTPDVFYSDVSRWLTFADLQEPQYVPISWQRDQWLRKFWRLEPHLAGVVNQVVALDKNRGWSMTGGRNQVYRMTDILHNAQASPALIGWRNYFSSQALSYYATDMCTVTEKGTEGVAGPLRALYHVDSARCTLRADPDFPLQYAPANGKPKNWASDTFFRCVSMPHDDETYNGLGFCAISRVLELAKLMVAIFRKDSELLGARMPEGLLLLQGIQQSQWDDAMADREAKLTAKERKFFGGVFVLATAGVDQVDAKLVALRQLPENFNLGTFTDQLMFAYALTLGYSPREFWPVSSGALGTATEAETQDANSTGKGESDFILNYQEQLNNEMPESILFEFDTRDSKGDLELIQILQAKADFIQSMAALGSSVTLPNPAASAPPTQELPPGGSDTLSGGSSTLEGGNAPVPPPPSTITSTVPLITPEHILELAVEQELIPEEWLTVPQDTTSTDVEGNELARWRDSARTSPRVQRALQRFPNEPIIRYHYPTGREYVLWEGAADYRRRRSWTGFTATRRELDRLTRAIEQARVPALPAPAAPAPPSLIQVISGSDGQAIVQRSLEKPAPPQVNVNVDSQPLADAIANIPRGLSVADIVTALGPLIAALPRPVDTAALATAMARLIPPPTPAFDYQELARALATALASSLSKLPAAQVTVQVPPQAAPQVTVNVPETPAPEPAALPSEARFTFLRDEHGGITEVIKTVP